MRKFISVLVSAAVSASAIAITPTSAEGKKAASEKSGMVILGDSIAAGFTVNGNVEHNYGEICGDYLGCDVANYAVVGDDTDDLIKLIDGMSSAQKSKVANAEYIVVSIGGNDIIEYVARRLLDFAATKTDYNFFNEGYSAADIPAKPSLTELMKILNLKGEGGIEEYATSSASALLELNSTVTGISADLCYNDEKHDGYIANNIIPNVKNATAKIKAINPDAKIIVQNIYQPFQFQPDYVAEVYGKNSSKASIINVIRFQLEKVMKAYDTELNTVEGIDKVDVKAEFTSLDETPSISSPGHASYFIDVQTGRIITADVHPNQKGHLAIAAAILDKIGDLHDDNGLLRKVYNGLDDKEKYPEIALKTYKKVAGKEPVVTTTSTTTTTTTTSTTTTTKKPTTTTTTSTTTTTKKPTTTTTTSATTTTKKPTTTTTTSATTTTKKPTTTTTTSVTTTAVTTTQPQKPTLALGDVNGDNHVDSVDASQVLKEYAAQSTNGNGSFTDEQKIAGDIDKNGMVDSVDASKILAYYAYVSNTTGDIKPIEEFVKK